MAYDVYWTGYEFTMDVEALNALGIPTASSQQIYPPVVQNLAARWSKLRKTTSKQGAAVLFVSFLPPSGDSG